MHACMTDDHLLLARGGTILGDSRRHAHGPEHFVRKPQPFASPGIAGEASLPSPRLSRFLLLVVVVVLLCVRVRVYVRVRVFVRACVSE